jgi:ribonuclease Z
MDDHDNQSYSTSSDEGGGAMCARSIRAVLIATTHLLACVFAQTGIAQTPQTSPSIKVTLLGTGSPQLNADRLGPCTLVEIGNDKLLFDAGRACTLRLAQGRVSFADVKTVLLTHLHADHTFALPDLFVTGWIVGRNVPLEVRGPRGTKAMMSAMTRALDRDIASRLESAQRARQRPSYVAIDIESGVSYERDGFRVTAFEVDHSIRPAFGYRIDANEHSVVLSGDTRYSEALVRMAQGVDVLVHEVAFGLAGMTTQQQWIVSAHTTPNEAARVFAAAKPKLALYSHLILFAGASDADVMTATREVYPGRVEIGTDLTVIEIGDDVSVRRRM